MPTSQIFSKLTLDHIMSDTMCNDVIINHKINLSPLSLFFSLWHQEGLRTLCVAYKRLLESEYKEACHHLNEAKLALQDREQRLAQAYDIIERDFVLLGATAVEDRLVVMKGGREEGKDLKTVQQQGHRRED